MEKWANWLDLDHLDRIRKILICFHEPICFKIVFMKTNWPTNIGRMFVETTNYRAVGSVNSLMGLKEVSLN